MAATAEVSVVSSPEEGGDTFGDDSRQEKKKKFKPFQKVRKFFRGGSSKKRFKTEDGDVSVVSVKAHSTSALHQKPDSSEDDDEGGFRTTPAPRGLAGSRSISEDSIFKPEQKEPEIGVLKGTAVSMEVISTDLQTELFNKLKARQASYSDNDDGLPLSPRSSLTTADLYFGGGLKSKSVPVVGKSSSRESDNSLISVGGSENEEDPFGSEWKAGVASVKMSRHSSSDSQPDLPVDETDFEVVMRTTSLSSEAAKHRISLKPKSRRVSSKKSFHKKEKPNLSKSLPGLKEESPSKTSLASESAEPYDVRREEAGVKAQPGGNAPVFTTTIPVGPSVENVSVGGTRSQPQDIPAANTREENKSSSPLSTSPLSQSMLQEVKLRSRPMSGKFEGVDTQKDADKTPSELSNAFSKVKRFSKRWEDESVDGLPGGQKKEPGASVKEKAEEKPTLALSKVSPKEGVESKTSPVETSSKSPTAVSFVLKKEPLRAGSGRETQAEKKDVVKPSALDVDSKKQEVKVSVVTRAGSSGSTPETKASGTPDKGGDTPDSSPSKPKMGSPQKLASPREDYRLKRQARSKTLPEQPVPKEMLDNAIKADSSPKVVRHGSPPLGSRSSTHNYDNVTIGSKPAIASKRASWAMESSFDTKAAEPSWVVKARLKQAEQEKQQGGQVSKEDKDAKKPEKTSSPQVEAKPPPTGIKAAPVTVKATTSAVVKPVTASVNSLATSTKSSSAGVTPVSVNVKPSVSTQPLSASVKSSLAQTSSTTSHISTQPLRGGSLKASSASVKSTSVSSVQSSSAKPITASTSVSTAKTTVTPSSKPSAEKPTSVTSKPPTDKPAATKSVFQKAGPQSTAASKPYDKPTPFGGVKPLSSVTTSVTKPDNKGSVSMDTKKPVTGETKKAEVEAKKDTKTTGSSGIAGTRSGGSVYGKPDTSSSSAAVPAWKQALNKNKKDTPSQVQIEIIDKDVKREPSKPVEKKVEQKVQPVAMREKPMTDKCADPGNRSSKVLDMVKSFQKMQVT